MSETIRLTNPIDVARVVPALMGFLPSDSLVVVGTGGAPQARLDLLHPGEMAEALRPAVQHWLASPVVVVVYSPDEADAQLIRLALPVILPGVTVADCFRVHDGIVYAKNGTSSAYAGPTGTTLDAKRIASSREELDAEAQSTTDPVEAETMAWAAYRAGDGARAWTFVDRAEALTGETSESMANLSTLLTNAVAPERH